jgi:hypothetical protein
MTNQPQSQKISNRQLLIAFAIAFAVNLSSIIYHFSYYGSSNLDGSYNEAGGSGIMLAVIGMLISIPLLCLVLALIIAAFLNQKVSYGKRLTRTYLWTLLIVNVIMVIRVLIDLVIGV